MGDVRLWRFLRSINAERRGNRDPTCRNGAYRSSGWRTPSSRLLGARMKETQAGKKGASALRPADREKAVLARTVSGRETKETWKWLGTTEVQFRQPPPALRLADRARPAQATSAAPPP